MAIAAAGATLIGYQLLEKQRSLETLQAELNSTSARALELEQHAVRLSFDREEAIRARLDLLDKLDSANSAMLSFRAG
jgi:hypothetical protein